MLTVHHLENSRSQRVLWLLEELGVQYEVRRYARDPKTMLAPPALRAVHPLGKSPVITDGSVPNTPVTVAETGAIIEYLLETHGGGRLRPPPGTPAARQFTYWLHYAEGSAMPPLLLKLIFDRIAAAPMPFFAKPVARRIVDGVMGQFVTPNLRLHLDFLESSLGKQPWFCGEEFTAADVMLSFPLEAAAQRAGLDASRPALMGFLQRIHARPAYQRALERGGPYAYA